MIRNFANSAFAFCLLAASAAPALAHVTLEQGEAAVGSTYRAVVRVPHGCGAEATHTLRVQIPQGFVNVKPMPLAGWTLETVTGAYDAPVTHRDSQVTEGVREIVWSGGNLPDAWYGEFVFRGAFATELEAGSTLHFPVVQECANGEEAWIDTDGGEGSPAPGVKLLPAAASAH
ncbi:YcnI family protein [Neomegalonema sp.]|uniref:YcnI family copper-binding membrane protein n=1 Tax=Neomegalonema sp. TaxID=2039713 RepID=UPI00262A8536|nr:YcnI family protein [Neomegalonema sp.]MDD2867366.1 YcnI family protein [Neomegalonema sp.]